MALPVEEAAAATPRAGRPTGALSPSSNVLRSLRPRWRPPSPRAPGRAEVCAPTVLGELRASYPGRVSMVDCGAIFLPPRTTPADPAGRVHHVRVELMPDGIHPSPAGSRQWAECLRGALRAFSW